jgi:lipoprotein-releasing system ATP-binding protein
MSGSALLELDRVTYAYGAGLDAVPVLRGVNLSLADGDSVAIVGPSGCGKSTLLNIIGSLDLPVTGTVRLDGEDLTRLDDRALAALRNRKIGFVFQFHHLLPHCTALENVLVPMLVNGVTPAGYERARRLLDRVGLSGRLGHRPAQLSGGECQRVAVVRALINQPRLLLADEPTGSLDRASAEALSALLAELNRDERVALICATHSRHLAARMGRVLSLADGVLQSGDAGALA